MAHLEVNTVHLDFGPVMEPFHINVFIIGVAFKSGIATLIRPL